MNETPTNPSESDRLYRVEEALFTSWLTEWAEGTVRAQENRTLQGKGI